jgi:phosphopantothenoylcysteine decarboxylase/phosphopantothenate--cysteine ligase
MSLVSLSNRRILLGVSGGIAAYKSAELTRLLKKTGADVRVVMTRGAQEFITPMTLQALSGNPVHTALLDPAAEAAMGHIELARWADLIVIAPATANLLSRLANGNADDLLSTLVLASKAAKLIAPAMNTKMWLNENTQANVEILSSQNVSWIGPTAGEQACGEFGPGRMADPESIVEACSKQFQGQALSGKHVVITAGPTREAIDPVRYISNHSSGKMGFALAQAAIDAGAKVTLISGPVNLNTPERCQRVNVISAQEMLDESLKHAKECDIFIACAAVADYRPEHYKTQKIKKENNQDLLTIRLVKNPDIVNTISQLSPKPFVLGFAAESQNLSDNAKSKLERKNLDMIAANDITNSDIGFNSEQNAITLFTKSNNAVQTTALPQVSKYQLACYLLEKISEQLKR